MTVKSAITIFISFIALAEVVAGTRDCQVVAGSYGECFKDESSGRMFKDRLIQLVPAENGTAADCSYYRVNQVESQACTASSELLKDYQTADCIGSGDWFRCANGRCIHTALQCNGDDDCGDASDEYPGVNKGSAYNCTNMGQFICGIPVTTSSSSTPPKSDRYFLGIPGLENLAAGFDLLTGTRKANVLSMQPLGSCRRILKHGEEDYYYRLPNNVNSLSQIFALEQSTGKISVTAAQLLTANQDLLERDYSFGGYLNANDSAVGLSQSQIIKEFALESIDSQNRYLAVSTTNKVKVFKIEMRSPRNLEASNSFLERLYSLPRNFMSYESYMSFIRDFGTHYLSSGVLGGEYTLTNFYDRCWVDSELEQNFAMDRADWEELLTFCERQNVNNKLNPTYEIPSTCILGASATAVGKNIVTNAVASRVVITGGSVSTTSTLQDSLTSAGWQAWANSVQDTPSLLLDDFELTRISKLLDYPIPTLSNEERLRVQAFLDEAISIYLRPYDAAAYCNCTDQCIDEASETDGTSAAYLTGTAGDEYFCRCACDVSPRVADCNRSATNYISNTTLLACLFLSITTILKMSMPTGG